MSPKLPNKRRKSPTGGPELAWSQSSPRAATKIHEVAGERLLQLIEIAPEGVTIHQSDRIVYANQAAVEQYGAEDPDGILGHDVFDFVVPVDRKRLATRAKQLYDEGVGGQSRLTRFKRLRLDGNVLNVETVAVTILWEGRPAILSMVRDVTALVRAEERLEGFLDTATTSIWETDAEHRFTYLVDFDQPDLAETQFLGKTRWELHGGDVENDEAWKAHVADLEAQRPFSNFVLHSSSKPWLNQYRSVSGKPIIDAHGVFKGYRGTARDVTAQLQAEKALRESDERFKLAIEGAKGAVFDIDLTSGHVTHDDKSAVMLGYDRPEDIPQELDDWIERVHPDDRDMARSQLHDLLEGRKATLWSEHRQRTRSGNWLWFSCFGKVVERSNDGRPLRVVGMQIDITERKQAERTIEYMALHDALTKLPNRVYFRSELERACSAAQRDCSKLAVLFLDLDHFKDINDTHGHSVGDKLLIEVANRLRSCMRGGDLVARFGGDEFVMTMAQPYDSTAISCLADRITKTIAVPYDIDGLMINIGISIGVAIYPNDGSDTERILANADLALYTAKRAGRQTWRVFDHHLQEQLQAQRSLDQELRHALDRHQFELHYQPLIKIADDHINGFEALIRWNHPKRGQILPDVFIPATEHNRLIIPLTEWVLQEAAAQLQRWGSIGLDENRVAINVSPSLFKAQGFVDLIDRCLAVTDCDPRQVTIEITEGALIDEANVLPVLMALRKRGLSIAADDFGTGYSSMTLLKTLPIDILKIDRSFVANATEDPGDATIVESLVNVGHSLGKKIVAEGVETPGQLDFLKRIGCDFAQGFFIKRPMPPAMIPPWVEQWRSSRLRCASEPNLQQQKSETMLSGVN